jgi:hypothetical protein
MDTRRIVIDCPPRPHFVSFHDRNARFACIVAHRRAGKTVACVHDLQRGALRCNRARPRLMPRIEDGINAVRVFLPKCWFDTQ